LPFLDINQEREFGYAGYDGMKELVRQLALTLESPVWAAVRKPAPWSQKAMVIAGPEMGDSPDGGDESDAHAHDHDHTAPAGAAA
ncbi:MAG: nitrogenase iron-molybdenum cofactor biosynthesis protein NifE, partial [Azoarcus sp.]|nr:nitrogenase iron-molybdenum cofactor biosynthesis protein NifE [Azoarcus sp.]